MNILTLIGLLCALAAATYLIGYSVVIMAFILCLIIFGTPKIALVYRAIKKDLARQREYQKEIDRILDDD